MLKMPKATKNLPAGLAGDDSARHGAEKPHQSPGKDNPTTPEPITVLVADAMPLVSDAVGGLLAYESDLQVFDEKPATGLAAVEAVARHKPDVALIDYWMADMEGAAATRLILARRPQTKVILMSWFHGTREIEASLNAGAAGFFPKSLTVAQVATGVRRAHAGESPVFLEELEALFRNISKRTDQAAGTWKRLETLSSRQLEILTLLSMNLVPKEVAKRLSISPQTVKVHLRNILEKADAHSYADVVTMARACGLIRN